MKMITIPSKRNYEAFERIDDGIEYLNPDHFSVNEMISLVRNSGKE